MVCCQFSYNHPNECFYTDDVHPLAMDNSPFIDIYRSFSTPHAHWRFPIQSCWITGRSSFCHEIFRVKLTVCIGRCAQLGVSAPVWVISVEKSASLRRPDDHVAPRRFASHPGTGGRNMRVIWRRTEKKRPGWTLSVSKISKIISIILLAGSYLYWFEELSATGVP